MNDGLDGRPIVADTRHRWTNLEDETILFHEGTTTYYTLRGVAIRAWEMLQTPQTLDEMSLVFSPLLDRFYAGQDFRTRPVKISDSGRIRNELQTLASEAIEYCGEQGICVHFESIDDAVLAPDKRQLIREVLSWYKQTHPMWFQWLVNE